MRKLGVLVKRWGAAARLLGIGWYIAASILLGVFLGLWLGRALGQEVLFKLLGLFLGLIVAFYGTYRLLLPFMKEGQGKDKE